MRSFKTFEYHNLTLLVLFLITLQAACGQNASVTIPVNKTLTWADKELYGGFVNVNASSTLQVKLTVPNKDVSFIIFQVHSYLYNVTLYNNTSLRTSTVVGTNVGLYSSVKPALDTFYIYNQNDVDLKVYVSVHGYDKKDPIPGGCNMEFPTSVAPSMHISFNKDFNLVDIAAPRDSKDTSCTSLDDVSVAFYMLYMPDSINTVESYFENLRNMLTLENIVNYGQFVPENGEHMRRRLASYPGTGAVHVAVAYSATNKSAYSVYVPDTTYGCDPLDDSDCDVLDDALSRILCVFLFFLGLLMCFFGHSFFKTEMFLVGTVSGVLVTYIVISVIADVNPVALMGASVLSGVCFGAIWLLFWWFYGIPLFAVYLSTLNMGFLFAAIVYHGLPGGLVALQHDLNFWSLFISIMLLTSLMLVSTTFLSNILCCALLGAYATSFSVDYSLAAHLKYIVINSVRRAVVPKFNKAILAPPYAWRDALVTVLWAVLALTGFLVQHAYHRGRAPFPPPPRSVRAAAPRSYGAIGSRGTNTGAAAATSQQNIATENNESAPLLA